MIRHNLETTPFAFVRLNKSMGLSYDFTLAKKFFNINIVKYLNMPMTLSQIGVGAVTQSPYFAK